MQISFSRKKPKTAGALVSSLDNSVLRGVKQSMLAFLMLLMCAVPAMAQQTPAAPAQAAAPDVKKVLAFGDSLTAGYGLKRGEALPDQLQTLFDAQGIPVKFLQGGVSGDTTATAFSRLEWTLKRQNPDYAIVALGGNDMLRAIDPAASEKSLRRILDMLKAQNIPVLLAGMRAPISYGAAYSQGYDKMYANLAKEYGAVFYPFLLEGVAENSALNLRDGVHPNAQGVQVVARGLYPHVVELLKKKK